MNAYDTIVKLAEYIRPRAEISFHIEEDTSLTIRARARINHRIVTYSKNYSHDKVKTQMPWIIKRFAESATKHFEGKQAATD